jgi:hypothetical protein
MNAIKLNHLDIVKEILMCCSPVQFVLVVCHNLRLVLSLNNTDMIDLILQQMLERKMRISNPLIAEREIRRAKSIIDRLFDYIPYYCYNNIVMIRHLYQVWYANVEFTDHFPYFRENFHDRLTYYAAQYNQLTAIELLQEIDY